MKRVIFHIDVNSAFLSWSAVRQVREGKPDLRLVPSVVSGDPNDRRSIVTAASMPAKKLGIKTAQPISMAMRTCPGLVIVRGDWAWYKTCSEQFTAICRDYSPILQKFSIDECFLDMTLYLGRRDPVTVAVELKNRIRSELGFTVNVGIGPNKLLAKMASDFEKPDKVHTLWKEEIERKMWPLGVRDLLWVGKRTEERLIAYGINTIGELARTSPAALARLVGGAAFTTRPTESTTALLRPTSRKRRVTVRSERSHTISIRQKNSTGPCSMWPASSPIGSGVTISRHPVSPSSSSTATFPSPSVRRRWPGRPT